MEIRQAEQKSKKKLKKILAETETTTEIVIKEEVPSTSSTCQTNQTNGTSSPLPTSSKTKRPVDSANRALDDPDIKKMKTDYSVAKDPKVTDVYKSLFTSHQSEKDQTRAHWVTYNPFYN